MAAIAALALLTALSVASGAVAQGSTKKCVPAGQGVEAQKINNLEAIIDDSYSMLKTDPNRLRLSGVELFIADPENVTKTLGVVEFGTAANTVFAPAKVGPSRNVMRQLLRQRVNADNGETNYDAGFNKANEDNPGAEARIFVTDGADDGGFTNSHRGGPRTFVVGLGIGKPAPGKAAANRLQQIADETGGTYFPKVEAATLQPTFKTISAALNCLPKPRRYRSGRFRKKGQRSTRTVKIGSATKSLQLALNWAQPTNRFTLSRVELLGKRSRVLASLSGKGKPIKIKVTKTRAQTFRSLDFKKARGATKLRFTVSSRRVVQRERTITVLTERE